MSGLFGGPAVPQSTKPTRANGIEVQQSSYGNALPLVYGKTRIASTLIDYGDFQAKPVEQQTGGKGGGGGGGAKSYTYSASMEFALCEGPIKSLGTIWQGSGTVKLEDINGTLKKGAGTQSPWSHWASKDGVHYPYIAYVACLNLDLGGSADVPNFNFEVTGLLADSEHQDDAEPSAIIEDMCGNDQHGIQWPYLADLTQYKDYCTATGLFISPALKDEKSGREFLRDLLKITNATALWSGGELRIIPYSDEPASGNGATYTPVLTERYALGPDDYFEPVHIERDPKADRPNVVRIEFFNRANEYTSTVAQVQDQADVDARGIRSLKTVTAHAITRGELAMRVAQRILQRNLYIRSHYSFKLPLTFLALEPGDIVTLTDPLCGLDKEPVRITKIEEDDDFSFSVEAEEFPAGVAEGAEYPPEVNDGYVPDVHGKPDTTAAPVFFRAPQFLVEDPETWIGAAGAGPNWGGANIWASYDGAHYTQAGSIYPGCRYGSLKSALAKGSDPDKTHNFDVDLFGPGKLNGGTQDDADRLVTLMLVDQELVSYETTVLNGDGSYKLGNGYMRRGAYNTKIKAHAQGAPWLRIDDNFFRLPFDVGDAGTKVWFKFQAFNLYGGGAEDLSSLTAYTYTLGEAEEIPDTPATPIHFDVEGVADGVKIVWSYDNPAAVAMAEVSYAPDNAGSPGTWSELGQTDGTNYPHHFTDGATYWYRARCRSRKYLWSGWTTAKKAQGRTIATYDDYIDAVDAIGDLQDQLDGQVVSWFYDHNPGPDSLPESNWTTAEQYINHEGDTFTNSSNGKSWRWNGSSWNRITDTATEQALADAAHAQDTADGKRRVFTSKPSGPYDSGDLWAQGDQLKVSHKHRDSGYTASDWHIISNNFTYEVYTGSSAPSNPKLGELWRKPDGSIYRYDGSHWKPFAGEYYEQTTEPNGAAAGAFWKNPDNGAIYRYNGSAWVQLATIGSDWFQTLSGKPRDPQNLIITGDFEESKFREWKTTNIDNPRFTDAPESVPFGRVAYLQWDGTDSYMAFTTSLESDVPVRPGIRIFRAGWVSTGNSTTACDMGVHFFNSAGAALPPLAITIPAGKSIALYHGIMIAPENAATMRVGDIRLHGPNAGDAIRIGPQTCSFYASEVYRLEGGPNLGAGLGSAYWDSYSLSVSEDAIGFSAGILKYQGRAINYSSHQWTGLSANTEYFCGCDDLDLDGTPESWHIDTDPSVLLDSPNRIVLPGPTGHPYIRTAKSGDPQSGSGGPGGYSGGFGDCVGADAWVLLESGDYKRARDLEASDVLAAWTHDRRIPGGKPILTPPHQFTSPAMRIRTVDAELPCSVTTPFDTEDGRTVTGPEVGAEQVCAHDGWQMPRSIQQIGEAELIYVSLGGYGYAAGAEKGRWIVSHNPIIPVKP